MALSNAPGFQIEWIGKPLKKAIEWIELYKTGVQPPFLPPLLETSFPKHGEIIQALCEIPFGQTIAYKDFAKKVGFEGAQRFIGTTIGRNPFPLFLPCHRVIRSDGSLGGFAFGLGVKSELLQFERIN